MFTSWIAVSITDSSFSCICFTDLSWRTPSVDFQPFVLIQFGKLLTARLEHMFHETMMLNVRGLCILTMEGHHHDWGVGEFDAEEGNDDEDGAHWSWRIFRAYSAMKLCAPHMTIAGEDNDWRVSEVETDEQMDSWSQAVWPGSSVSQNPKQPRWQVKDFIFLRTTQNDQ